MNVLITGASSGIGAALAAAMTARGDRVGIVGRRADKLEHTPAERRWVQDLGDLDAAGALAIEAWDHFGGLDVLVNNAAIPKVRSITRMTDADVEEAMRVNFLSPVRMTLAVLPRMLERGSGCIVNVGSLGGRVGINHEAAYCASKFALTGWSESLAMDLDGTGVKVRLVQPGPIDTDIWDRPGEDHAVFVPDLEPPSMVADGIIAAIESDSFEHFLPDLKFVLEMKLKDIDGYIKMNADMRRQHRP